MGLGFVYGLLHSTSTSLFFFSKVIPPFLHLSSFSNRRTELEASYSFPGFVATLVVAVGGPLVAGYFLTSGTLAPVWASAVDRFEAAVADSFSAPAAFGELASLHALGHPASVEGL